jgi:plasmid stability protein
MSIEDQLKRQADAIAAQHSSSAGALARDYDSLRQQLAEIEEKLKRANLATARRDSFQPSVGHEYTCPRCWIEKELRAVIEPIGGGSRTEDYFRCRECRRDITIFID